MTTNGNEPTRLSLAQAARQRIHERLKSLAPELEQEIALLDAQLDDLASARDELAAAKREAISALRIADPEAYAATKPGPKPKATSGPTATPERVREVADQIEAMLKESAKPGNADGFITRNWIADQLDGVGLVTVTPAVELLITDGVLRADRKVRGGGMAYALIR